MAIDKVASSVMALGGADEALANIGRVLPIREFGEWEQSIIKVRNSLQGREFSAFNAQMRDVARTTSMTRTEFTRLAADYANSLSSVNNSMKEVGTAAKRLSAIDPFNAEDNTRKLMQFATSIGRSVKDLDNLEDRLIATRIAAAQGNVEMVNLIRAYDRGGNSAATLSGSLRKLKTSFLENRMAAIETFSGNMGLPSLIEKAAGPLSSLTTLALGALAVGGVGKAVGKFAGSVGGRNIVAAGTMGYGRGGAGGAIAEVGGAMNRNLLRSGVGKAIGVTTAVGLVEALINESTASSVKEQMQGRASAIGTVLGGAVGAMIGGVFANPAMGAMIGSSAGAGLGGTRTAGTMLSTYSKFFDLSNKETRFSVAGTAKAVAKEEYEASPEAQTKSFLQKTLAGRSDSDYEVTKTLDYLGKGKGKLAAANMPYDSSEMIAGSSRASAQAGLAVQQQKISLGLASPSSQIPYLQAIRQSLDEQLAVNKAILDESEKKGDTITARNAEIKIASLESQKMANVQVARRSYMEQMIGGVMGMPSGSFTMGGTLSEKNLYGSKYQEGSYMSPLTKESVAARKGEKLSELQASVTNAAGMMGDIRGGNIPGIGAPGGGSDPVLAETKRQTNVQEELLAAARQMLGKSVSGGYSMNNSP